MKKTFYFILIVLLSMVLIQPASAEEKVKPDNQNAVIVSSLEKSSIEVAKISEPASGVLSNNFDIEIEYDPGLCNHLKKICRDASPVDNSGICEYFTEKNCPIHFP